MEVALLILAIGLLSILPLAVRSLGQVREASMIDRTTAAGASILDSLAQLERPAGGSAVRGEIDFDWVTSPAGSAIRIELHARRADGHRRTTDTMTALAAPWPARLHRVP